MPNFTRKAIKSSFIQLINERPLNQVTIKEIVEDCGINRNSFYYHFADLPTLIEEIIQEDIDRIINDHSAIESIEECLNVAIDFGLKNKRAAYHIYNSVNRNILERYLLNLCQYAVTKYIDAMCSGMPIRDENKALIIQYYKCVCFGHIIDWMNSGMKDDILEQFHKFCNINKGMIEDLLRRCIENES